MQNKHLILTEAVKLVPFDGWNNDTLRHAAKNAGLDENYAEISFKPAPLAAVTMYLQQIDSEMLSALNKEEILTMKIRERIFHILNTRFNIMDKNKAVIRKTVQFFSMPANLFAGTKLLWELADKIWYAAGDTSSDFNYYTKRATLMAVYSSTLLFWLEDESENHAETDEFLRRRIENVMQVEKFKARFKKG